MKLTRKNKLHQNLKNNKKYTRSYKLIGGITKPQKGSVKPQKGSVAVLKEEDMEQLERFYKQQQKVVEEPKNPVIITKNSTLGHLAVIPTVVRDEDAVILDHQVHWSVQNAAQLLKVRGIPVQLVRHNNLEMLETLIQKLSSKVSKRLTNKSFVSKAPKNIVDQEKSNYSVLKNDIQKIALIIESL